jgi:hypothetical protein
VSRLAPDSAEAESGNIVVVHNAASSGSSINVAMALLFLGLLVLGSGVTLWHRRSDML